MRKILFPLLLLALYVGSFNEAAAYYGKQSMHAILTYKGEVLVEKDLSRSEIKEKILEQTTYLLGTFHSKSFVKEFGSKGVVGEKKMITNIKVKNLKKQDYDLVSYSFKSKALFDKDAFGRKKTIRVPIKLPLLPSEIYQYGLVGSVNKCTDKHYNGEGDFFYFWDPDKRNCPLKGNSEHVLRFSGQLKKLSKSRRTRPPYEKIFGDNGNGDVTRIDLFFGYVDDKSPRNLYHYMKQTLKIMNPNSSLNKVDDSIISAYEMADFLEEEGFSLSKRVLYGSFERRQVKKLERKNIHVEHLATSEEGDSPGEKRTYTKVFSSGKEVQVNIVISDTAAQEEGEEKTTLFKNSLENALMKADIIQYEGHSGLGANLDLNELYGNKDLFDPDKAQIIFINGCHSYSYYKDLFFKAKNNSKNLDLILSGLSTLSDDAANNTKAFIKYFLNPEKKRKISYQAILNAIEKSNNDENGTYLTSVFGDSIR